MILSFALESQKKILKVKILQISQPKIHEVFIRYNTVYKGYRYRNIRSFPFRSPAAVLFVHSSLVMTWVGPKFYPFTLTPLPPFLISGPLKEAGFPGSAYR